MTNDMDEKALFYVFTREPSTAKVVVVEVEADFCRDSITNEDPPNANQTQHRPKPWFDECVASVHP